MKNTKLISILLIILLSVFLGCVNPPAGTPTPTAKPTVTETIQPTVVPTTPIPTPTPAPRKTLAYKTFVDQDFGFKRVIELNYTPFTYENLTLNMHVGDNMTWINDATPDEKLTILSEQNLWNESRGLLRWNYQYVNYTFTQPGTYGIYIKEYPRKQHQIIIVSP
ncbi:MAG: hypothetical protein OIN66_12650 [Candidatus Methanoperedens sp.]|nr:hypothetical protein [Candidatus Methanoperedens sp.]